MNELEYHNFGKMTAVSIYLLISHKGILQIHSRNIQSIVCQIFCVCNAAKPSAFFPSIFSSRKRRVPQYCEFQFSKLNLAVSTSFVIKIEYTVILYSTVFVEMTQHNCKFICNYCSDHLLLLRSNDIIRS